MTDGVGVEIRETTEKQKTSADVDMADMMTNDVGVAIREIKEGQRILINCGYYLGMIPVYTDRMTWTVHKVTSRWRLAGFATLQGVMFLHRVAVIVSFLRDYLDGRVDMSRSYDAVHTLQVAGFIFSGFLHLHTAWKGRDIAKLINTVNKFYTEFGEQFGTAVGPSNRKLYGKLLKVFFWGTMFGNLGSLWTYLSSCELHYDSRLLNICIEISSNSSQLPGRFIHASIPRILIFSATLLFSIAEQFISTYLYVAFAVPTILTGLEMISALKHTSDGSHFRNNRHWMIHYKSIQIAMGQINEFTRDVLMPGHIFLLITLIVYLNYVIIRTELDPQVRATEIIIDIFCCGFVAIVFGFGGKITATAGEALASKKALMSSKRAGRELNALQEIRIGIGRMRYLDREATLIVCGAIVDNTVDMLLTFK